MSRIWVVLLTLFLLAGCAKTSRDGIISEELPLTLQDLSEIRSGNTNHDKILQEYTLYRNPRLELYANTIAAGIADVSTRPHLPYKVFILDTEEINLFGGPGGYIYISRGLFNFIDSESELAAVIAHEISHIANHEYDPIPGKSKMKNVYDVMLKGSELARDSIGSYGTAVHYGVKGIGKAAPIIRRRFSNDEEIVTDEYAIDYLVKAGYDPRALGKFIDKLSRIPMEDVHRFVIYLNTHPPFQDRQKILAEKLQHVKHDGSAIEVKQDMLNEVRQMTVNPPNSNLFEPQVGVSKLMSSVESEQTSPHSKSKKVSPIRKTSAWF